MPQGIFELHFAFAVLIKLSQLVCITMLWLDINRDDVFRKTALKVKQVKFLSHSIVFLLVVGDGMIPYCKFALQRKKKICVQEIH